MFAIGIFPPAEATLAYLDGSTSYKYSHSELCNFLDYSRLEVSKAALDGGGIVDKRPYGMGARGHTFCGFWRDAITSSEISLSARAGRPAGTHSPFHH